MSHFTSLNHLLKIPFISRAFRDEFSSLQIRDTYTFLYFYAKSIHVQWFFVQLSTITMYHIKAILNRTLVGGKRHMELNLQHGND